MKKVRTCVSSDRTVTVTACPRVNNRVYQACEGRSVLLAALLHHLRLGLNLVQAEEAVVVCARHDAVYAIIYQEYLEAAPSKHRVQGSNWEEVRVQRTQRSTVHATSTDSDSSNDARVANTRSESGRNRTRMRARIYPTQIINGAHVIVGAPPR